MKRYISIILLVVAALGASAQTTPKALWPIKDGKAGENIIGKPGQYINGESNYDALFIGSPEGTSVVAPVDGTIVSYKYVYQKSPYEMVGGDKVTSIDAKDELNFRIGIANELKRSEKGLHGDVSRYTSIAISIQVGKNEMYTISGLRPTRLFKTGDKVKRGDVIGKVGYAYYAFDSPHIVFNRSTSKKSDDPMGIFGIPSSFVKNKIRTFDYFTYKHPVDSLKKDFNIFRKSLEEIHPGLYDYTSKAQMDSIFDNAAAKLNRPMVSKEFYAILKPIIHQIRDCHTSITPTTLLVLLVQPPVRFGYDGGELVVISSLVNKNLIGSRVVAVNGVPSKEIISKVRNFYSLNEGYNTLPTDRALMTSLTTYAYGYNIIAGNTIKLKMKDGREVTLPYSIEKNVPTQQFNRWAADSINFSSKMVKPDVAYLDINTFELNQIEEDSVENFIGRIQRLGVKNLVVDVRDNGGGYVAVGNRILSYLIDTSKKIFSYRMVNSNTTYPMLKHSESWTDNQVIFPHFKSVEGRNGFYDYGENDSILVKALKPYRKTHYYGNIYVLANEYSASMASEFPAILLAQPNCKIIGRETGSCYYQMNADSFANILMLTTGVTMRIPMVKIVMRDTPNPRIPYGHGVIPDYNVPLTLDELTKPKDVILNRALEIIEAEKTR